MDFILDNQESESRYKQLLAHIHARKNGDVAQLMKGKGLSYKMIWGVSLIELRQIAREFEPNHVLALKLWNKQWRETMILATLLDNPLEVTEEQMDFWTKSFENSEIAEQASANLWAKTKFAFVKALEWCRGKKHLVRYTGIHLLGRLAVADKNAIDEMFEPFFEELPTLAKDDKLYTPLYRTGLALGSRSVYLNEKTSELAQTLQMSDSVSAVKLGEQLFEELNSEYIRDSFQ